MGALFVGPQGLVALLPHVLALFEREVPHGPAGVYPSGQAVCLILRGVRPILPGTIRGNDPILPYWFIADIDAIRTGRHCGFLLHAHLVFVTKYRYRVFTGAHLTRLEQIMRDVCTDFETELVEFNGEDNHVHLLVTFPPKVAVSHLVNSLKGVSSRRMRQEFPELSPRYWRQSKLWSGSYVAGSVAGAPLSILKHYIQQQNQPV